MRALGGCLSLAVAAAACSSSEPPIDVAGTDAVPVAEAGQAGELTDSVQFLGAMVVAQTEPVVTAVGDDPVSLVLDPDASFAAASGAFPSASEVTTQVFDINLSAVFEDDIEVGDEAPWSRAYVVSTADPVDLTTPVTIEIARPVADLLVVQLIDGELVDVVVDGDAESAVIEIPHFSDVVTIVMNTWGPEAAELARQQVAKFTQIERRITAPAGFLRTCLVAMISILNGQQFLDNVGPLAGTLGTNLAYSFCVNALVQGTAPNGVYVSTECVGGRISGGVDFVEAVDLCAADNNGEGEPNAVADPTADETPEVPPVEAQPEADGAQDWTYVALFDSSGLGGGINAESFVQVIVEGGVISSVTGGSTDYEEFPEIGSELERALGGDTQGYVLTIAAVLPDGPAVDTELPITFTRTGDSDGDYELQYPVGELAAGTLAIDFQGTMAVLTITAGGIGPIEVIAS